MKLRINQLRAERGITQAQLAKRCGIATDTISSAEREENIPNARTLLKIAKGLDCPIEALFFAHDCRTDPNTITTDGMGYMIRARRIQAGFTIMELSDKCASVSKETLTNYELCYTLPDAMALSELSYFLKCEIGELFMPVEEGEEG